MKKTKEKKQAKMLIISAVVIIVIIIAWVLFLNFYKTEQKVESDPLNNSTNIFFYYGFSCTHCLSVEEYMTKNDIERKISQKNLSIIKKETFKNIDNNMELNILCTRCNIKETDCGVPMVYYAGKCYMGSTDVLSFLDKMAK